MKFPLLVAAVSLLAGHLARAATVPKRQSTNKRGLSFTDVSQTTPFGNSISWVFNWAPQMSGTLTPGVEYVPMLWGTSDFASWNASAKAAIEGGSVHLLGFNEPDQSDQANMSPIYAADAWRQYMEPFAGQAKLVSPAILNGPQGKAWMDQFFQACSDCTVDAVALHIYNVDEAADVDSYEESVTAMYNTYNRPVWLTEFADTGESTSDQQTFLTQIQPFLDGADFVERYAYFSLDESSTGVTSIFVNPDGTLSDLGQTYASA
ncbi:hypothetical protein GLOTRDRAFT_133755 [Gloeophyllum trabeum ATCC 11539]|uniref:Asl1-like glycosyl hydrolase catalytic domain-containing protein n=1 Tax=Gloeophyllum trabeum (strain ATCC 11539 / FP-39264 / Madison 617) TaxID=670483 RepID=S7RDX6_GLOTA|nr:uncharacterized protein GLOTRDRAFT_133755 [Gloeophyllum trabeum ATCC 11539]EPQ50644.1 hypothetical protein GLOTRDRAFT_133755 [Gloeophyllum trabeum ATCC 11539]